MSKLDSNKLKRFLLDAKKARVAIIGDIMLDHYTYGESTRLSPEAPVPIVDVRDRATIPGGAGNVARNVTSLGSHVDLYSVLGSDEHARHLVAALRACGISTRALPRTDRMTTVKERIVVDGHHVVRMDRETRAPIDRATRKLLIDHFASRIAQTDVLIFSDYAKGVISPELVREFCRIASKAGVPILVDTKPVHAPYFAGKNITLFTPNLKEALEITRKGDHKSAGNHLREYFSAPILITKGGAGMTLYEESGMTHVDAHAVRVEDVSGCGDTVAAIIAIALATNRSKIDAIHLANHAAGIVVQKPGTATITPREFLTFYGE